MIPVVRRTQVLLAVVALGAAGMFLGPDGWHGIDVGSAGSAVLYAALWLIVVHLAKFSGEVFPDQWSLAEKQAWVGIVFMALTCWSHSRAWESRPIACATRRRARCGSISAC